MSEEKPIVNLDDGQIQGTTKFDWLGGKYYSFQGIPYAKPPVGKLRFKAPQPVDPWIGIKDASKEGNGCYSRHLFTQEVVGSEDCLYLNVYTPQLYRDDSKPKAVMVWIHGGGFAGGSGSIEFFGPDFLISEDVVIVTINYRLGLLGFAYFTDPKLEIPGNAGFKDQVLALKWVQRNISKFGGNANNVTIFGVSAGGASVHLLMLSPLAKGLFHRAIAQSGVSTAGWCNGQLSTPPVAEILGLENVDEAEVAKILSECPVEKVLEVQEKFPEFLALSERRLFGLITESPDDESAFISHDPNDILASGNYSHVPLMIGYVSKEGMFVEGLLKMRTGEFKWIYDYEHYIPSYLQLSKNSEVLKLVAEKVKNFYHGNQTPESIDQYYSIYTDTHFFIDTNNAVRGHTETSTCPIYYYRMSVETGLNVCKIIGAIEKPGACHGDDIGYLFKNNFTPEVRPRSQEDVSLRRFLRLWSTFAKYGDPNPVQKDDLINIRWQPTEKNKLHYLEIGENLTVGVNPDSERVAFWDEISDFCASKSKS